MKSYKYSITMFVALFALNANAGESGAHGGNSVVCYAPSGVISSVTLFDYWEQSQETGNFYTQDMGAASLTEAEKVEYVLRRLDRVDPLRTAKYRLAAKQILDNIGSYLLAGSDLAQVNDDNATLVPKAPCFKRRFAVQRTDVLDPNQKKMFIVKEFYTSADAATRAGIILHEIIYTEAIAGGQKNSDKVRYFNYMLSTKEFNSIDQDAYLKLLKLVDLSFSKGIVPVQIKGANGQIFLDINGRCVAAVSNSSGIVTIDDSSKRIDISPGAGVVLNKDNSLNMIWNSTKSLCNVYSRPPLATRAVKKYGGQLIAIDLSKEALINKKGIITKFKSDDRINLQGVDVFMSSEFQSSFTDDDKPLKLSLKFGETYNLKIEASSAFFEFQDFVQFNKMGEVTKGFLAEPISKTINGKAVVTRGLTEFRNGQVIGYVLSPTLSKTFKNTYMMMSFAHLYKFEYRDEDLTPDREFDQKYLDAYCQMQNYNKGISATYFNTDDHLKYWEIDWNDISKSKKSKASGWGDRYINTLLCGTEVLFNP